ncbi:MAG TPA: phosphotransferase [Thermomicrobiales bacterium]|nr:phosphotransferase [Thermomicrobiales bacterium]
MNQPVPHRHVEPLAGLVSTVVRIGDEVRREMRLASPAVHALLVHLERAGFEGAPRFLGIDEQGRERLTFVPGQTYDRATPETIPDAVLPAVGRLIRRYHDVVANFTLPDGLRWHAEAETTVSGHAIVCHNDISPRNIVFRDGQPVALIDWDMAHLAPPLWDVAHAVWQFSPVLADPDYLASGWTQAPSLASQVRRMRLLVDGYGVGKAERAGFAKVLALRIRATATGIRRLANEGHPVFDRLVTEGVVDQIERSHYWTVAHQDEINAALL